MLLSESPVCYTRRVKTTPDKGNVIERGKRIGRILLGSRVDLFLPKGFKPAVKLGDQVGGGCDGIRRTVMVALRVKPENEGRPAKSKLRKTIYLLPNLFTAGNMVLGILAIAYGINDSQTLSLTAETKTIPFVLPAELIIIATFADFFDGMVARATGTTSKFGMEFDSLSDLVSFGMAPAILIYLSVLRYLSVWGISITVFYVVCAAIRLARFNVQAQVEEKTHFMGLPSPAAAGILASYIASFPLGRLVWKRDFHEQGHGLV